MPGERKSAFSHVITKRILAVRLGISTDAFPDNSKVLALTQSSFLGFIGVMHHRIRLLCRFFLCLFVNRISSNWQTALKQGTIIFAGKYGLTAFNLSLPSFY